jgi:hypothetical protein
MLLYAPYAPILYPYSKLSYKLYNIYIFYIGFIKVWNKGTFLEHWSALEQPSSSLRWNPDLIKQIIRYTS